jgi:hypothetical protein
VADEDEDGPEDNTVYIHVEDSISVGVHESKPVSVVLVPLLS